MSKHQAQTDNIKEIPLPSTIQQVYWDSPMASAGGTVVLEIFTHYVGNGSEMEIELSDQSGKAFGNFNDQIHSNRFRATILVPKEAREALYANVKLLKHGLDKSSNPLILLPPIEITNAKWDKAEARRGDILKLTADVKTVADGTEGKIEIWEHDQDGAHDLITQFPVTVNSGKVEAEWEFEYHEDTDDIPSHDETEKGYFSPEYFFRVKVNEFYVDSELLIFKDWIEYKLMTYSGNERYKLIFPDGTEREGDFNDEGVFREEGIVPGRYTIEIILQGSE